MELRITADPSLQSLSSKEQGRVFVWSFQLWHFRVVSGHRRNMGYLRVWSLPCGTDNQNYEKHLCVDYPGVGPVAWSLRTCWCRRSSMYAVKSCCITPHLQKCCGWTTTFDEAYLSRESICVLDTSSCNTAGRIRSHVAKNSSCTTMPHLVRS